jgi:hypothetical protein
MALGDRTLRRSDPTYLDAMVGVIGNSVRGSMSCSIVASFAISRRGGG